MDNEQGLSCGCSPGDIRFKSESFSWAWGVLRTPQNLLAVVTPGDEEPGVPLVNKPWCLHSTISTFCCIPLTKECSPALGGISGAYRVRSAPMYHGTAPRAWCPEAENPGESPGWCHREEELVIPQGELRRELILSFPLLGGNESATTKESLGTRQCGGFPFNLCVLQCPKPEILF